VRLYTEALCRRHFCTHHCDAGTGFGGAWRCWWGGDRGPWGVLVTVVLQVVSFQCQCSNSNTRLLKCNAEVVVGNLALCASEGGAPDQYYALGSTFVWGSLRASGIKHCSCRTHWQPSTLYTR
jgi:hypothetical protein